MGQKEGPLAHIEKATSNSEYEPEAEFSIGLVLLAQQLLLPIPPPLIPTLLLSPPSLYTISQPSYLAIIRQL